MHIKECVWGKKTPYHSVFTTGSLGLHVSAQLSKWSISASKHARIYDVNTWPLLDIKLQKLTRPEIVAGQLIEKWPKYRQFWGKKHEWHFRES